MKYKYVIFDFDGTLFDSRKGIVGSIKYALDALNIQHPSEEILTSFIGPPLGDSFQRHLRLSPSDTELAIHKLREHYEAHGHMQSIPYVGCLELIHALLERNSILGIATAKPTPYAKQILLGNKWSDYFKSVRGSDLKGELFPKERTIGQVINDFNAYPKEQCVMIGDTIYDVKGAQQHQIDVIAVNYGYGKTQDLKDAKPNYMVENVQELQELLFS